MSDSAIVLTNVSKNTYETHQSSQYERSINERKLLVVRKKAPIEAIIYPGMHAALKIWNGENYAIIPENEYHFVFDTISDVEIGQVNDRSRRRLSNMINNGRLSCYISQIKWERSELNIALDGKEACRSLNNLEIICKNAKNDPNVPPLNRRIKIRLSNYDWAITTGLPYAVAAQHKETGENIYFDEDRIIGERWFRTQG